MVQEFKTQFNSVKQKIITYNKSDVFENLQVFKKNKKTTQVPKSPPN